MVRSIPTIAAMAIVSLRVSSAAAERRADRPKLILNDVIGLSTSAGVLGGAVDGWVRISRTSADSAGSPSYSSTVSYGTIRIAPRFEVMLGRYVSLGAEVAYNRFTNRLETWSALDGSNRRSETTTESLTAVPLLGARLPLPAHLSLWAHAGVGGGVGSYEGTSQPGSTTDVPATAVGVLRVRTDVRVGFEPVRGAMLTFGPDLTHVAQRGSSATSFGLFAGLSFVIR